MHDHGAAQERAAIEPLRFQAILSEQQMTVINRHHGGLFFLCRRAESPALRSCYSFLIQREAASLSAREEEPPSELAEEYLDIGESAAQEPLG